MKLTGLDVSDHYALQLAVGSTPSVSILAGTQPGGSILHGSLAEECPDLARQWIHESTGSHTPSCVSAGSGFTASWRCDRGCEHCGLPHEWVATVAARSQLGNGCPFCSGHKTCKCRSLAAKHPELMEQWDWDGNQGTDSYSVSCYSLKRVSWICTEHGEWDASPSLRVYNRTGCPKCAKQRRSGPRPQRGLMKDELPKPLNAVQHLTGREDSHALSAGDLPARGKLPLYRAMKLREAHPACDLHVRARAAAAAAYASSSFREAHTQPMSLSHIQER